MELPGNVRYFRFLHSGALLIFLIAICISLFSTGCSAETRSAASGKSSEVSEKSASSSSGPDDPDETAASSGKTAGSSAADSSSKKQKSGKGKKSAGKQKKPASAAASSSTGPDEPKETKSSSGKPAGSPAADSSTPRLLDYVDAWQEWHTMEVDPAVNECLYDPGLFIEKDGQMTYEDDRYEVLQGVDVSEYQGYIDWDAVAQAGCSFAFIRVGYRAYGPVGQLFEDSSAIDNLQRAKAAGLLTGAYIFSQALNEEEARAEADLAVRVIQSSGVAIDLPLIYDPEIIKDDEGRANDITREQVSLNTAAFRDEVETKSSLKADIYSNLPWEHNYFDAETMNQYEIWYADYEKPPQTPYHFTWWQYTNEGYLPGIDGQVDLNLWIIPKGTP